MIVKPHLPPMLINPIEHPWLSKGANFTGRTLGKASAGMLALPISQMLTDDETPIVHNLVIAAVIGGLIGAATGTFFPAKMCRELNRWEAIRAAAFDTAVGAPIVAGTAMVLANKFLGGLVEFGTDGSVRLPGEEGPPAPRDEPPKTAQ